MKTISLIVCFIVLMFFLFINMKKDDAPFIVKYDVKQNINKSYQLHIIYKDSTGHICFEETDSRHWSKVVKLPPHCSASLTAYLEYRSDICEHGKGYNPFLTDDNITLSAKIIHPRKTVVESGDRILMLMLMPQDLERFW